MRARGTLTAHDGAQAKHVDRGKSGDKKPTRPARWGNEKSVVPKGAFKGHDRDLDHVWISNYFFTHRNTPEQAVYLLAKTLIAKLDGLRKKSPHFDTVKAAFDLARKGGRAALEKSAPLHPGALRAMKEAGILK